MNLHRIASRISTILSPREKLFANMYAVKRIHELTGIPENDIFERIELDDGIHKAIESYSSAKKMGNEQQTTKAMTTLNEEVQRVVENINEQNN